MKDAADLLTKSNQISDANRILKYIDLIGRMRGLGTIAGGLYKALKRGKVPGLERMKLVRHAAFVAHVLIFCFFKIPVLMNSAYV